MNTVGKAGRLGGDTRCVVSVSMLTEGWDASTVTHVLGVRAFGTQLLCEQVIGRALRRQSYDLNEEDVFDVEYADVLGIPFDFTARPVVAPPQPPRETVQVKAISPERDACEIRFPRVQGYRVELPEERLSASFDDNSTLELTPDLVGPSITRNEGIVGEGVDLSLEHLEELRPSTVVFHLTKRLLETKWRDPGEEPKLHLFGQLKRITRQWLKNHLVCKGGTWPAQLLYQSLADTACERITRGIVARHLEERPVQAVLDPYNPVGSSMHVRFTTSKKTRWETNAGRCHVNWVVCDSEWEAEFCRVAEAHPRVRAYVKNHGLEPGGSLPLPGRIPDVRARLHRPGGRRARRGGSPPPGGRDQGVPPGGCQGEGGHHADLLGAGGERAPYLRALGLRGVRRRIHDAGGLRGEGGSGVRETRRRSRRRERRGVKTTRYFDEQVRRKRPYIDPAWCVEVIAAPLRREDQPDGRVRFWGAITVPGENAPRILRVVTLDDGETVHNEFFDRCFRRGMP